jgi:ATP-dependent Clp protease adaptor protein ClpS
MAFPQVIDLPIVAGGPWAVHGTAVVAGYNWPMSQQFEHDHDLQVAVGRPQLQKPPRWQVLLLNDDYTPMDFVIEVLQQYFNMDMEQATQVMLHVHTRGRGACGVFTREVAETKVALVNDFARMNQHPLLCTMELADS